jgi:heme A synthase
MVSVSHEPTPGITRAPVQTRLMLCLALSAVALGCGAVAQRAAGTNDDTQAAWRTLRNARVGYSLSYPTGWKVAGKVVATQFAAHARCQSVRIVDRAAPSEVRQTVVQICWTRITEGSSLAVFMRRTYGRWLSHLFARTTLGGVPAYRTRSGSRNRTFFLQTKRYRMQILTSVVEGPAKRTTRSAQVKRILASFTVAR